MIITWLNEQNELLKILWIFRLEKEFSYRHKWLNLLNKFKKDINK